MPQAATPESQPSEPTATPPSSAPAVPPSSDAPHEPSTVPEASDGDVSDFIAAAGIDAAREEGDDGEPPVDEPVLDDEPPPVEPTETPPSEPPVEAPVVVPPVEAVPPKDETPLDTEPPKTDAEPPKPAAVAPKDEWGKIREEGLKHLTDVYRGAVTDADKEIFGEELATRLPDYLGRLHMNVYESVMNGIYAAVPDIVRSVMQLDSARGAFDAAFYGKWPTLKQHAQDVERAKNLYIQLNPKATAEEVINDVGLQLSIARKLPLPEGFAGAAPKVDTQPPKPPTFTPVGAGGAGGTGGHAPQRNAYSEFLENEE